MIVADHNKESPLVSVIIPSYNHERYVGEAIESVLTSSLKNIELIVIDDGSKDNSMKVISSFKDPRVRVVAQENKGAHAAINRGASMARSKLLAFLNSDDKFHPDKLKRHLEAHTKDESLEASICRVNIISEAGTSLDKSNSIVKGYLRARGAYTRHKSLLTSLFVLNHLVTTSALCIRKDVFESLGGFAPLRYVHDWFMFLTLADRGRFLVIEEPLVHYRRHGGNVSAEDRRRAKAEINFIIEWQLFEQLSSESMDKRADDLIEIIEENPHVHFKIITLFQMWRLQNGNSFNKACRLFVDGNHPIIMHAIRIIENEKIIRQKTVEDIIAEVFNIRRSRARRITTLIFKGCQLLMKK